MMYVVFGLYQQIHTVVFILFYVYDHFITQISMFLLQCFYKEKILLQTKVYVLLAMFLWAVASYFFYFRKIISWKVI